MKFNNEKEIETIRVLVVDDEILARDRIKDLLLDKKEYEIIGECSNGKEAVEMIDSKSPDLLFLDVQMPDLNGFQVLENITVDKFPAIIFVTAYDKYALKAFEFHAVDYLLKPFKDDRFEKTLEHTSKQIKNNQINILGEKLFNLLNESQRFEGEKEIYESKTEKKAYQNRFIIKSAGKISFLDVDEVDWIGAEGSYVSLNVNNKANLMRDSLKNLEKKLDPAKFIRIHRSTIVNLSRISQLRPYSYGEYIVILKDGKRLRLSRTYREKLESLLNENI